jgi:hypothetical protein
MPSVDNMNNRIKELIDQSITGTSPQWLSRSNAEKLAELIVRDCMLICEDVMKKDNSALGCWSEIKRKFRS